MVESRGGSRQNIRLSVTVTGDSQPLFKSMTLASLQMQDQIMMTISGGKGMAFLFEYAINTAGDPVMELP